MRRAGRQAAALARAHHQRRAAQGRGARRAHRGRGRQQHRGDRRRRNAPRRAAQRGGAAGARVLQPRRRAGDGDRRERRARPPQSRLPARRRTADRFLAGLHRYRDPRRENRANAVVDQSSHFATRRQRSLGALCCEGGLIREFMLVASAARDRCTRHRRAPAPRGGCARPMPGVFGEGGCQGRQVFQPTASSREASFCARA